MKLLRIILFFTLLWVLSNEVKAQCTDCTLTYSSNGTITATADNQVICITGGTSYEFSTNYRNTTVKVCADNVTFTEVEINSSGFDAKIETWGINTDLHDLSVDADTFSFITNAKGAKLSSGNPNKITKFHVKSYADLTVAQSLNPGQKIFFRADQHAVINTASITSNRGGEVYVGGGAEFNSSGNLILQNDGELFNTGSVTVSGNMSVQGGANAMNNYCGSATIVIEGTFTIDKGTINSAGSIQANTIKINGGGGPVFPHEGAVIEAVESIVSNGVQNIFRGDSIPEGMCATLKTKSLGAINETLISSPKIFFCDSDPSTSDENNANLGPATKSCDCASEPTECLVVCEKPDAGSDELSCTSTGVINLKDATGFQKWIAFSDNPTAATVSKYSGEVSGMNAPGVYQFILRDTSGSTNSTCLDTVAITVNQLPSSDLTISGSVVCSTDPTASITIENAEAGVNYTVLSGTTELTSSSHSGASATNLVIDDISVSDLAPGVNVINVKADIAGCASVDLTDTTAIVKNLLPDAGLTITGSVICSNETPASITVENAAPGVTYTAYLGTTQLGSKTNTGSSPVNLILDTIPTASLETGVNSVSVKADIAGCAVVDLTDTAGVKVVPNPSADLTVTGEIVCSNVPTATITVREAEPNVTYSAILGGTNLGSATNTSEGTTDLTIEVSVDDLAIGFNEFSVNADIISCATVNLSDTAGIEVIPNPSADLNITGETLCSNESSATVVVEGAEPGVTYSVIVGGVSLGEGTNSSGSASNLPIDISVSDLAVGYNEITVNADISPCGTVALSDTAAINVIPNPSANLTTTGQIVCSNESIAEVVIEGAEPNVTYSAILNGSPIGSSENVSGSAANLSIELDVEDLQTGWNVITVNADINTCGTVVLTDTAGIKKVPNPSSAVAINGGIICSNEENTTISIINAEPNVTYTAKLGGNVLGSGINSVNTPTTIDVTIPVADLNTGLNVISVEADIDGCATVALSDTAHLNKVPNPSSGLTVTGGIVCSNVNTIPVIIENAEPNVTYSAYRGSTKLGTASTSTIEDLEIDVPVNLLGNGNNTINITADINGCSTVALSDTAGIKKVPNPSASVAVTGGVICSNQDSTIVLVENAEANVKYTAFLNGAEVGLYENGGATSTISIKVPVTSLSDGTNIIDVSADINGCATVNLTDTARIERVPNPQDDLTISGGIICSNETESKITIENSNPNVTYTAYIGNTPVGVATNNSGTTADLDVIIPNSRLSIGTNLISVEADISGCAEVAMTDTAAIEKVPNPSAGLTVNGNILCSSSDDSTFISISGAEPGVTYSAYLGANKISEATNETSSSISLQVGFPITSIQDGDNIISVRADINGCNTVNLTDTAKVTLDPEMTPGSIAPDQNLICSSTSPELTNVELPTGGLPPYTYSWEYSTDKISWSPASSANTAGPLTTAPSISQKTYYRRIVESKVCTAVSTIDSVEVTGMMVGGAIEATEVNVCNGVAPGIIVSNAPATGGTGTGIGYQWQSSPDGNVWSNVADGQNLEYQPEPITTDKFFRRRATNGTGACDTTYAGPVQIALYKELNPGFIQLGDTTVCEGSEVTIKSTAAASNGAPSYTYIWQQSVAPFTSWTDIANSDTTSFTVNSITEDTRYRRITVNECSSDTTGDFYQVNVLPNLVTNINVSSIPTLLCNTAEASIIAETENAGANRTLDWYYNGNQFLLDPGQPDSVYTKTGSWNNEDTIKVIVTADPDKLCTTPSDTAEVVLNVNYSISSNKLTGSDQIACSVDDLQPITGSDAQGSLASPSYVWQISTDSSTTWSDIEGANGRDYKPEISTGIAHYRRIAVSAGACNNDTATASVKVMLDGEFKPGVLTADPDNICQGVVPSFQVTSPSGGLKPYTYQWEKSVDSTVWVAIDGANDSVFTANPLNRSTYFRRRVTSGTKVCEYNTPAILINIDTAIVSTSNTIAEDQIHCFGTEADEITGSTPSGGIQPVQYKWIASLNGTDDWFVVEDSARKSLYPGVLDTTTYFKRVITSTGACTNDTSLNTVKIYIDPTLNSGTVNSVAAICSGSTISMNATEATGGTKPYSYIWQYSKDSTNWGTVAGESAADLSPQILDSSAYYRRIVISNSTCRDTTAGMAVTVDQPIQTSSNTIANNSSYCLGGVANVIEGSVPSGGLSEIQYQWVASSNGVDNWRVIQDSVRKDFAPGALDTTTYFKRIVTSTGACDNDTSGQTVRVFVDPLVNAGSIESVDDICSGTSISVTALTPTGGTTPYSYQWQSSSDNSNWTDLSSETNEVLSDQTLNSSTFFRRIVRSQECADTTEVLTVTVDQPVDSGSNSIEGRRDICYGVNASVISGSSPSGGLDDVQYQWLSSPNGTDSWTEIPNSNVEDYDPGVMTSSTFYKRVVTSTGACDNDTSSGVYEIFVDPTVNSGQIGDDQQFCDKDTLYLDSKVEGDGGSDRKYVWQVSTSEPPNWQDIPNTNKVELKLHKNQLPQAEVLHFRRVAESVACSDASNALSVYPCLDPDLVNLYPADLCLNENITDSIVVNADHSRNGGSLIPRLEPAYGPSSGIVDIDSVNNTYTYQPNPGFVGKDSVGFTVCDTSMFSRCSVKKVVITVLDTNSAPVTANEYYAEYRDIVIEGNILRNDYDRNVEDSLYVVTYDYEGPAFGTLSLQPDGEFKYQPDNNYVGKDSAIVKVCDYSAEKRCDQRLCTLDTLHFTISPNRAFVPDGFSPNNDGVHDYFIVKTYAPSRVNIIVYNRWGNPVYENNDYKNDWDGIANKGIVIGEGLPDGTYYMYFNINDGEFEGFKYITISR